MCRAICATVVAFAFSATGHAQAQSLRVAPVTIDLPVSVQSAVLTVGNDSPKPLTVQTRVFRWSQRDGQDVLEKTSDVVVSPPILTVSKGTDGTVRVARVSSVPVSGEETYRILLDEVPSREKMQGGGVAILMRQSLPVFFAGLDAKPRALSWQTSWKGNKLVLRAANSGEKHVRLTQLRLLDETSKEIAKIDGLAGYVLGGQTKSWELPLPRGGVVAGTPLSINATTDTGPIHATAIAGNSG
ncbi:MAG: molecular chaperone [Rhodomicrobium sp.]